MILPPRRRSGSASTHRGLVDLLDRVAKDDAFSRALALFSSHPLTEDRRKFLEALDVPRPQRQARFQCRGVAGDPGHVPARATAAAAGDRPSGGGLMRILIRTSKWAVWARRLERWRCRWR